MSKYEKYIEASRKGIKYLADQLDENGQYTSDDVKFDIDTMYKLPNQLLMDGRPREANRLLDNLKKNFLQPNGDFLSFPEKEGWARKTGDWHVTYNWPYVGGWIVMAAQKAGRFDISFPSYNYLMTFWNPTLSSFNWFEPYDPAKEGKGIEQSSCMFLTSHLATCCLFFGDLEKARCCGEAIIKAFDGQPDLDDALFLKITGDKGEIITEGWEADNPTKTRFFRVKRKEGDQFYWQLGYPIIFLTKLYSATGEQKYLDYAKKVLDFANTTAECLTYEKSHKVMYGAALVAVATKDEKYKQMAETIADNILTYQEPDGHFLPKYPKMDIYDQTSENSGWFRELYTELDAFD